MEYLRMKKRLTKIALAASLLSMPALVGADEYHSLLGFEGGYSNVDVESTNNGQTYEIQKSGFASGGLKIGAESEDYRIFLSARYYNAKDFSKLNTVGGELQYKFNFSKRANFFLGGNVGKAYMRVSDGMNPSVSTDTTYLGGDAGFNIHATELIDLEVGARYMSFDETVELDPITKYKFSSLVTAYASIIIKWKMD